MKKYLTICLLLACSGSVLAEKIQTNYLCITEMVTGFIYQPEQKKWIPTIFSGVKKFILKVNDKNNPEAAATVTLIGQEEPAFYCPQDMLDIFGYQMCISPTGQFSYNLKTLRFLKSYLIGYIDGKENKEHTPTLHAGICSPL